MRININLTEEQEKAILTQFVSIEIYLQQMIDVRAWRIINNIVREYAKGNCKVEGITAQEQAIINAKLEDKIIVQPDRLPNKVKAIIVRRAKVKSAVEKIAEQELLDKPMKPIK